MALVTVEPTRDAERKYIAFSRHGKRGSRLHPRSLTFFVGTVASIETFIIIISGIISRLVYFYLTPLGASGSSKASQKIIEFDGLEIFLAVICALVFAERGLYTRGALNQSSIRASRLAYAIALSFLIMLALLFLLNLSEEVSRGWIVIWFSISTLALYLERMVMCRWFSRLQKEGLLRSRVAVYGPPSYLMKASEALEGGSGYHVIVGRFATQSDANEVKVDGGLEEMVSWAQKNICDQIVIAFPLSAAAEIQEAIDRLSVVPVDLILLPELGALPTSIRDCKLIGGLPAFEVRRRPLSDLEHLAKSAVDLIVSAIGLVLLAPIFIVVGLAIKLDSRGPVFFAQRRNGYNGKIFQVLKFRTMNVTEDDGEIRQARAVDERVTRVGRLLRRTSLDELPQLWNVLEGNMSLVGPRPHALSHNKYYARLWRPYSCRHRVKPGITGWAQVNGLRGETSSDWQMQKRVEFDLYYIDNWSLGFDLKILVRTLLTVLTDKNAY